MLAFVRLPLFNRGTMAHEGFPSDRHDDIDAEFRALVEAEWKSGAPSMWEKIDKGVRRVLERARLLEEKFNQTKNASNDAELQVELMELNHEWDKLGYELKSVGVIGRLRPVADLDPEELEPLVGEGIGLEEKTTDLYGEYYKAAGYRVQVLGFDLETLHNTVDGPMSYKIMMALTIDDEPADNASLMMHVGDVEYIDVPEPTAEGAEAVLWDNFPDLMQYTTDKIPDDCGSDKKILEVLDDFAVTFDVNAHTTTLTAEQICMYIDAYITARLGFDDSMEYTMEVDGIAYGENAKKHAVPRKISGSTPCRISSVRLIPGPETEGDGETYQALLEVYIPLPGRNAGWTKALVLPHSIENLWCDRPTQKEFVFDDIEGLVVFHPDQIEPDLEIEPSPSTVDAIGKAALDAATQEGDVELSTDQAGVEEAETEDEEEVETREQRLERYAELRAKFLEMYIKMHEISKRRFATEEESIASYDEMSQLLTEFTSDYPYEERIVAMLSGEAVIQANTVTRYKPREDGVTVEVDGINAVNGDLMTQIRGVYMGGTTVRGTIGDQYAVSAYLYFVDVRPPEGVDVMGPTGDLALFRLVSERKVAIDVAEPDLDFDFLALERARRCTEALETIAKIDTTEARREQLAAHVTTFSNTLEKSLIGERIEFDSISDLNTLAITVMGDEEQSDAVASALNHVIGNELPAIMTGAALDKTGKVVMLDGEPSRIVGVVSRHPALRAPEPALLIEVHGEPDENGMTQLGETRVVPLSTITGFAH